MDANCPGHPLAGDQSAAVHQDATVELTLLRSPMALGDRLAEHHAMVSLLAQLRARIPLSVAGARTRVTPGPRSPLSSRSLPRLHGAVTAPLSRHPMPDDRGGAAPRRSERTRAHVLTRALPPRRGTQVYPTFVQALPKANVQ